jgi:AraC family transcriptional regulator
VYPSLEDAEKRNALFVDHVALALQAHPLQRYATIVVPSVRRGLAPWQERRAKEAMYASLDKDICIAQLASDCGPLRVAACRVVPLGNATELTHVQD